ncbi:ThuA domain-containing protein [Pedobacter sp. HMF7647]|uniref:ThuA domain-containing protein n=1 Tax=Hufsiella arboris TaxID=2695275 RepID=A0A7K1Y6X5_9SPHI|nr:ThuA domain-containing protein [Hufsiella arboris]MXV50161.1 ThuA domain-containing protein [Hufsiella arboris]
MKAIFRLAYLVLRVFWVWIIFSLVTTNHASAQPSKTAILVLYENGGHHLNYSLAAKPWLDKLAGEHDLSIRYIQNTDSITDEYLSHYKLFIQLDYPPYAWKNYAVKAFEKYISQGKGGWIGFHHATLLGEFDGYPMWQWFFGFMGGIRYKNYIPDFASASVKVEDRNHPVMKGVPSSFYVENEEWYTYDRSPRLNVHVLASVDETTYSPDSKIKMGDHPVVWTNPGVKAKNVYIFMGHSPELFKNKTYCTIFRNAVLWASSTVSESK